MFQLFKKRNFSELIGDTFTFFKINGKHYFRNYFIINGGFLLVLLVLTYFLMKVFFDGMQSNFEGGSGMMMNSSFENFINGNLTFVISLGILMVLCILFLSLLSYAFPVAYLNLMEKKTDFSTDEIIAVIKSKAGKIVIFFIASLFILLPIMFILVALGFALAFILIGIPLLMILIPALMCWYSLSFYDYISSDKGYFDALGTGFNLLRQKFWPTVGSTMIIYLIVQIIIGFVSMIPYVFGIFSMFTSVDPDNASVSFGGGQFSFFMIMMGITMILSILMNFIFQNFILVNQGIIYYSLREENENNTPKSEIDLIGIQSE